jgi:hypothetical protein
MTKRARSFLTGLLMSVSAVMAITLPGGGVAQASGLAGSAGGATLQADFLQPVWSWIQEAAHAVGTFFASMYASVYGFFASGEALRLVQSATHGVNGFGTRVLLPVGRLIAPGVNRLFAAAAEATPELVALWLFWIVILVILVVLIAALRPRHATRRLPKVTPRAPGQEENTIEFGMVEQGPQPSPSTMPNRATHAHEPEAEPAPREQPTTLPPVEQISPSPGRTESPVIPEISLEPLGLFGEPPAPQAAPSQLEQQSKAAPTELTVLPLLETVEPHAPEAAPATEPEIPVEELLSAAEEAPPVPAPSVQEPVQPIPEPTLIPLGEQPPMKSQPPVEEPAPPLVEELTTEQASVSEPEQQPLPTEQAATVVPLELPHEEATPASQQSTAEEPFNSPEASETALEPAANETPAESAPTAPAAADLLTRLLDEEESFPQAIATAEQAASPVQPPLSPTIRPTPEPSVFGGNVDLDALLSGGVVTDATALGQLFRGGYRNRISKLAVSAKDLQNVPEDMRQVIKLTVVALSPIELSIARDLAMRLEAPGFVGEALLVAKKMGYEHYLTTYRNISKNYKDVTIVETASLKVPASATQSSDELISFN